MDKTKRNILIVGGLVGLLYVVPQMQSYYYMSQLAGFDDKIKTRSRTLTSELPQPAAEPAPPQPLLQAIPLESYSQSANRQPAGPSQLDQTTKALEEASTELAQLKIRHKDLTDLISTCYQKENMITRLACYDKLSHNDKHFGDENRDWSIERTISPIDDSFNIHLTLVAKETVSDYGRPTRPTVTITCGSNPPLVALNTRSSLTHGYQYVIHRVGSHKAQGTHWRVDDRGQTAMLVQGKAEFIDTLMGVERLAIEYAREYQPTVTLTFDTHELNQVRDDVLKACSA